MSRNNNNTHYGRRCDDNYDDDGGQRYNTSGGATDAPPSASYYETMTDQQQQPPRSPPRRKESSSRGVGSEGQHQQRGLPRRGRGSSDLPAPTGDGVMRYTAPPATTAEYTTAPLSPARDASTSGCSPFCGSYPSSPVRPSRSAQQREYHLDKLGVGRNSPPNRRKLNRQQTPDYFEEELQVRPITSKDEPLHDAAEEEEIYVVKQNWGYCSIAFSVAQTIIMVLMMWQCGIAPLNINPMVGPYPDALSEWGGKNSILILEDGEWWRLLTPILLHAGIIHLLCNVAVQLETGVFFEKEWGSTKWFIVYLASAVGSSALSVIVMPDAISVGSSGAVMGLFGGKLGEIIIRACERVTTDQDRVAHQVRKEQCAGVTCSVILVMLFSFIPYVDWAAHLGGLIAGLAVGIMVFALDVKHHVCFRLIWLIIGAVATLVLFVATLSYMYSGNVEPIEELRDVCGYYKQAFEDYECQCMKDEYMNGGGDGGNGGD